MTFQVLIEKAWDIPREDIPGFHFHWKNYSAKKVDRSERSVLISFVMEDCPR